jgi:hypothetical protein
VILAHFEVDGFEWEFNDPNAHFKYQRGLGLAMLKGDYKRCEVIHRDAKKKSLHREEQEVYIDVAKQILVEAGE